MHPAVVMIAITAGASVAGIVGMLMAVPVTAAVFGVLDELRQRHTASAEPPSKSPPEPEPS
ncbi:AI-2E family transporter [Streptomyces hirsutus]